MRVYLGGAAALATLMAAPTTHTHPPLTQDNSPARVSPLTRPGPMTRGPNPIRPAEAAQPKAAFTITLNDPAPRRAPSVGGGEQSLSRDGRS